MDDVREFLYKVFGYGFYPTVVISMFIYIVWRIVKIIGSGSQDDRVRRAVGAALPLLVLVFLVVSLQDKDNPIEQFFGNLTPLQRFIGGAVIGFALMGTGHLLLRFNKGTGPALYALFLSLLGSFFIWAVMGGILKTMNLFFLGSVITGCLYVVFLGHPMIRPQGQSKVQ